MADLGNSVDDDVGACTYRYFAPVNLGFEDFPVRASDPLHLFIDDSDDIVDAVAEISDKAGLPDGRAFVEWVCKFQYVVCNKEATVGDMVKLVSELKGIMRSGEEAP